jgi:hypothetical protein
MKRPSRTNYKSLVAGKTVTAAHVEYPSTADAAWRAYIVTRLKSFTTVEPTWKGNEWYPLTVKTNLTSPGISVQGFLSCSLL